ncbi:MAG: GtrA family protein [Candidatus Niyogibacteria bacterium]|nr:GtrA family protein [Candidatus Niyogibacteria bacterium]
MKKNYSLLFKQFAKFFAVGLLNTAIDFGVLNLLIFITDITSGIYFSVFKAASFIVASVNSYIWNRLWVFGSREKRTGREFAQFLTVSIIGAALNVGAASFVVNYITPQFGFGPKLWANIGAVAGTAAGLIWNFLGYKFVVFKE